MIYRRLLGWVLLLLIFPAIFSFSGGWYGFALGLLVDVCVVAGVSLIWFIFWLILGD